MTATAAAPTSPIILPPPLITAAQLFAEDRFELFDDVAVDRVLGRIWLRDYVAGGARKHSDRMAAAEAVAVHDVKFRAPEIWERLSINDYLRHRPALNATVFRGNEWEWTCTAYAPIDGDFWIVTAFDGLAYGNRPAYRGFVRAVSAGQ